MPVQFEKWFRVDLSKKAMTEWVGSSFFTNDNLSNIIGVELYDGMDPVDVPGTIQGIIILPNDGTITVNGSRTGNKAWIELPSTALALDGMITITIRATVSDRKVTLVQCSGRVNVTDTGMAIDPDDILPHDTAELMELIGDLRDVINEYTDIIMVQDTQPDTETNKLWLKKTTPDGVSVPTMEDLEEVSDDVADLKSAVTQNIGYVETSEKTLTFTDGKTIDTRTTNPNYGAIIDGPSYSVTDKILCENASAILVYYTGSDIYGSCMFYTADDSPISYYTVPSQSNATDVDVPENASYFRFTSMTTKKAETKAFVTSEVRGRIFEDLDEKVDKDQGIENAGKILCVGDDGNVALKNEAVQNSSSANEKIPLFVSMMPDFFWVSTNEVAAFSASLPKYKDGTVKAENNAWFQISGNQGDSFVTVIPGGNGDVADITSAEREKPFGCVIMYDDGRYYPCNAQYLTDTTFSVWPPLKENITGGELAQIRTGIHLSRRGYRAYAQYLYSAEPKHCEKSEYIAKWRVNDATIPWEYYGASYTHQVLHENISTIVVNKLYLDSYVVNKATSHAVSNTDSGISWPVPIDGKTGYVEFYIGIRSGPGSEYELDSADAIHCELWLDGVKTSYYDKTIKRLERVCFDFSGAQNAELKIYGSRWQTTDVPFGFYLNRITWWVNKKYTSTEKKLFPTGAVVGQLFDSWGEFDDAESAVYLQKEINADAGVTVPYFNGSLSNQTSAWGKAWFYDKIWQNRPSIMITDFGINDQISAPGTSSLPATITGPDGKTYDNIIGTVEEYSANMDVIKAEAMSNGILPIFVGVGLATYQTYPNGYIDSQTTQAD